MAKRKLETAEQNLTSGDQPRKVKKRKDSHEPSPSAHEAQGAETELSTSSRPAEAPKTESRATRPRRKSMKGKRSLGQATKEGPQGQDEPKTADERALRKALEENGSSGTGGSRKRRKRKDKDKDEQHTRKADEQPEGMHVKAGKLDTEEGREKRKKKDSPKDNYNAQQSGRKAGEQAEGQPVVEGTLESDEGKEKRTRRKRHKHKTEQKIPRTDGQVSRRSVGDVGTSRNEERKAEKKANEKDDQHEKVQSSDKRNENAGWRVSDPVGGHMVDLDPIFSHDEKHLLIAYYAGISIYSTSTSLLVRKLPVNKKEEGISDFALAPSNPDHVYVSTVSGLIERWNWVEGSRLAKWKLSSSIYSLTTAEDSSSDLVYTVDRKGGDPWLLSVHRLGGVGDPVKTDVATLLKYQEPLSSVQVLEGGRIIVAASGSQLILGHCEIPDAPTLRDLSYVWHVVDCPELVTSIDSRISPRPGKEAERIRGAHAVIDIAVGGLKGPIHVYEDLLTKVVRNERSTNKGKGGDITSRKLHWHRNSVLATKWSLDGNYVISGGQESSLVLWQLETGQKQFLPHLGATVESIVVSPSGTSYSVRLADNSAMVLSTSELKPTFSTAGIQIPSTIKSARIKLPSTPNINTSQGSKAERIPACVSSGHLLLAVPPSVTSRQASISSRNPSYLQTFDIGESHQISRQALARTKVTTLNMGPESNLIEEPAVTHLQSSSDGKWLATVDVWMPPQRELAALAFDQERVVEEQIFRQEIFLKFWLWKDDSKMWELVSRINNPHASENGIPYERGRILELASHPTTAAFATVGENGILKTWRPALRRRHGLEVRSKDGNNLTTWYCKHTIPLESTQLGKARDAKLAYSQDGSVLVVGLQSQFPSAIYLIDTYSGEVRSVQTGLCNGPLLGLGIINKYLITLSHELCVWDLVTEERRYCIHLKSHALSLDNKRSMIHLAVDAHNGLFAIVIPTDRNTSNENTDLRSQIAIFDPTNPSPLFLTSLRKTVTHLLPAARKKGFYVINQVAEVRTLAPKQSVSSLAMTVPNKEEQASFRGLTNIFGNGQDVKAVNNGVGLLTSKFDTVTKERRVQEDDAVVVSQERLAEVFDVGPAYALPPVMELFEQVASLYSGRVS